MRNNSMAIVCISFVGSVGINFFQQNESRVMKIRFENYQAENRLLREQITELSQTLLMQRTYEDGLNQGIMRASNTAYVEAYHYGIARAVEQKEYEKTLPKQTADKPETQLTKDTDSPTTIESR